MKPTPELVLNQTFARIAMELGPALPPGYSQGSATLTAVLLLMVAQEFNRAAAVRKAENDGMRHLFGALAAKVGGELGRELGEASRGSDADLGVAALDKANGTLKTLLIELHAWAETAGERDIEHRILRHLQGWASARQVVLPPM